MATYGTVVLGNNLSVQQCEEAFVCSCLVEVGRFDKMQHWDKYNQAFDGACRWMLAYFLNRLDYPSTVQSQLRHCVEESRETHLRHSTEIGPLLYIPDLGLYIPREDLKRLSRLPTL